MAVLKEDGNIPSESERFIILVIGGSRESMHDFRSFVGIRSSEHVEFEEVRIALRTSRVVAGRKSERRGGALVGGGLRFRTRAGVRGVNLAQRFVIYHQRIAERQRRGRKGNWCSVEMEEVCDEEGYQELSKVFGVVDCR